MQTVSVPIRDYEWYAVNNMASSVNEGPFGIRCLARKTSLKVNIYSLNFAMVHE